MPIAERPKAARLSEKPAIESWADHLESILSGKPKAENVVALATASEAHGRR